jgi:hypothetical protein
MLNALLATLAATLWLSSYGMFFAGDIARWWRLRPYREAMSEFERLQAVRAYAEWVRNPPPAPVREKAGPALVPEAELPPIRGVIGPFPGRRIASN